MNSLHRSFNNDSRWQFYKRLELLSDSTPNPDQTIFKINLGLAFVWRSLLSLLVDELVNEQRVEYLERCWMLDQKRKFHNPLKQFLTLIE
jgi:hypothetical protein